MDLLEGEHFPDEAKLLKTVPGSFDPELHDSDISRCPHCGQAYSYYHKNDNDVYNLFDYATLERVNEEHVNYILTQYHKMNTDAKKRRQRFWYKARKKFGDKLKTLPEELMQILLYLKECKYDEEYLSKIANDLL